MLGYADQAMDIWAAAEPWQMQAGGALLFVVATVMVLYGFEQEQKAGRVDQPTSSAPTTATAATPAAAPLPVKAAEPEHPRGSDVLPENITPQFLVGLFQGVTAVQGKLKAKTYIGRLLQLTARISNVSIWESGRACVMVKFQELTPESMDNYLITTMLYFDHSQDRLEAAQIGDQITAVGRIAELGRFDLILEDCKILALGPAPQG